MAKKQTRRSISINRTLYDRAAEAAAVIGVPLSQLTEYGLHEVMENCGELRPADILERNAKS